MDIAKKGKNFSSNEYNEMRSTKTAANHEQNYTQKLSRK